MYRSQGTARHKGILSGGPIYHCCKVPCASLQSRTLHSRCSMQTHHRPNQQLHGLINVLNTGVQAASARMPIYYTPRYSMCPHPLGRRTGVCGAPALVEFAIKTTITALLHAQFHSQPRPLGTHVPVFRSYSHARVRTNQPKSLCWTV